MFLKKTGLEKRNFFGSIILFLLFISACTSVRFIQDYDEITDQRLTALQEKSARFFVKMERQVGFPEADYKNYLLFYEDVKTELSVLEVRSRAIPKSEIVQQQIISLQNQFTTLEKLHKIGFKNYEEIIPVKNAIENSFAAIIKLQMSLKSRIKL